jgi:hypothetical protein
MLNARGDAPFQAQIDAGLSAPNAPSRLSSQTIASASITEDPDTTPR